LRGYQGVEFGLQLFFCHWVVVGQRMQIQEVCLPYRVMLAALSRGSPPSTKFEALPSEFKRCRREWQGLEALSNLAAQTLP
jgi:hypothetical protein